MYHQLNKVTGRLSAATHLQSPLFPVVPVRLQRMEAPGIVHTATQMSTVTQTTVDGAKRRLVPGTNIPFPPVPEALRKKQEHFQKENDVPVFLKGGPSDAILYRLTLVLCAVGLAGVFQFVYEKGFKKPE